MARSRLAVLIGKGRYDDEIAGYDAEGGPRRTYLELARSTGADIRSFRTGVARHGRLFGRIFSRSPLWGSAVSMALNAHQYETVYVTGEDLALRLLIVLRLIRRRARVIFIFHNATAKKLKILRAVGHAYIKACITLCTAQQRIILNSATLPTDKVVRMFEAVDTEFFCSAAASSGSSFIACGAEARDYNTMMEAAKRSKCRGVVYGHGYMSNSVASSPEMGGGFVECAPRVSYSALRNAYAEARFAVVPLQPSRYASGLNGLLEAMAMGLPVIITETEGLTDYVDHKPGMLVEAGDVDAMATAFSDIMQAGLDADEFGSKNREWINTHCRIETFLSTIMKLVEE